jgi:hypothetical protein
VPELGEFADAAPTSRHKELNKLADLLQRSGIDIEDVARVNRVNAWQGFYKDADGEAHKVDMVGIELVPSWDSGPAWPVVQQAKPCVVRYTGKRPHVPACGRKTVLLPDLQIGYRRLDSGELIPMHDERAMATALDLVNDIQPDAVVWLGDTMDLPEWSSKFLVLAEFVLTTQPTVDRTHRFLADTLAAAGPQCEDRWLLEGNHDNRMANAIARNAMAALRLRQANTPESWPVMSVPHLLRLEELGITYVDGYPAGRIKIASRHGEQAPLYALHGEKLDMAKQAKAERVSTVQGHAHHVALHSATYDDGDGQGVDVEAWSLGCLCRRDGAVPSTKGGTDVRGRPIERIESWQHAIGVVAETEDGWWLTPVRIRHGIAHYQGRTFGSREEGT